MKNFFIGLLFILMILVVGLSSFYLYKKSEVDSEITKLDGQIQNATALQNDIYTSCMDGKEQTPQNKSICEQNTDKQILILSQDATSKKNKLKELSIVEILRY